MNSKFDRKIYLPGLVLGLFTLVGSLLGQNSIVFGDYFHDRTMRVDFQHLGDAATELIVPDRVYEYGFWAGSMKNLIDTFGFGYYRYQVFDTATRKLLFSRDFSSNYGEYRVTPKAVEGKMQSFHESALFPAPKRVFRLVLEKREPDLSFTFLYEWEIDPSGTEVIREQTEDPSVMVFSSLYNGDSHEKIDIVYVAEGYQSGEVHKFEKDLERFTESLFLQEPLRSNRAKFNIWGVFKPSPDSGVDQPTHQSYKKTVVGASFNSFDIERYLLINDNKDLRDIAGHAPYDALFILVNHERYGGAGMYNLYCTMTSDNEYSDFLMIHEFGHSFFGLADEYYTSEVGFDELYAKGYEPIEANITALGDPARLKWAHLVEPGTPIPTPWDKAGYDQSDEAWQVERAALKERIASLTREGAGQAAIEAAEEEFANRDGAHSRKMYDWLHSGEYAGKVGAYEGAGYISKGMYRPMMDCIMFSKRADAFCSVCAESMQKMIDWYTE